MKRFPLACAAVIALITVNCASTSHTRAPSPTASETGSDYAYFKHRKKAYQLRLHVERTEAMFEGQVDGAKFHPLAKVSVWQYNPDTAQYDIQVSKEEPVSAAFSAAISSDKHLFISGGSGVSAGRMSGIPGKRLEIELRIYGIAGKGDRQVVTLNARVSLKGERSRATYAMAERNTQWVIARDSDTKEGMSIALTN